MPPPADSLAPSAALRAATRATYTAFAGTGLGFATWTSRIPQVKNHLHLDASQLGLVLLSVAAGSVVALPLAGPFVARFGPRRLVAGSAVLFGLALVLVGIGYAVGVAPVVVGLFLLGAANGAWDVAMNVHGADVEQRLGRSIMPRFHAAFSVGTVVGALLGAAAVALDVSVTAHLAGIGVLIVAVVPVAVRRFVPHTVPEPPTDGGGGSMAGWRERRTLLIGLFVLAFAFAEGTGNDWIGLAVIDGYRTSAVVGTLAFATFLAAMTAGRWWGPALLDRFGSVRVVRTLALVAVGGLLVLVFGRFAGVAFLGAALWGLGVSLGFPVGMSAGADDPAHAAGRVGVISSIGYVSFLGGPPLIGFLAQHLTVLRGLLAVAVLLAVAMTLAGVVRGPDRAATAQHP